MSFLKVQWANRLMSGHDEPLFRLFFPLPPRPTKHASRTGSGDEYAASARRLPQLFLGISATSRIEVVRVSSWKCGRKYATASYQPGLPATARTSTRASVKGRLALISSLAP